MGQILNPNPFVVFGAHSPKHGIVYIYICLVDVL